MLLTVATTSTPLDAGLIQAKYGRFLAPFYDRYEMLERRAVVVRIETVGDFAQLYRTASACRFAWTARY